MQDYYGTFSDEIWQSLPSPELYMTEVSADSLNVHNFTACPTIISQIIHVTPITLPEPILILFGNKTTAKSRYYMVFPGTVLDRMYIIDSLSHCSLSVPELNLRGLTVRFTSNLLCKIIDVSHSVIVSTALDVYRDLFFSTLLRSFVPIQYHIPRLPFPPLESSELPIPLRRILTLSCPYMTI